MVDVYKLASGLGINRINFNSIYTYKNNTDYRMPTFDEYFNAFEDVLRYHYEIESPIIIQQDPLCIPFSHSQLEKYYLNNELIIPQFNCRAGIYSFEVDPAGKVYPCSFLHGEEFLAGDIRKNSISEIWTNNANWENAILSKIKNGLTFIFNIDTGKIVVSSKMAYDLLKFIENNDELQDIQHFFKENYNITSSELNNFLEILIENKMIII